jgi:hypothetical protein
MVMLRLGKGKQFLWWPQGQEFGRVYQTSHHGVVMNRRSQAAENAFLMSLRHLATLRSPPHRPKCAGVGDPGPAAARSWSERPLTQGLSFSAQSAPRNAPGLNSAAPHGAGLWPGMGASYLAVAFSRDARRHGENPNAEYEPREIAAGFPLVSI